MPSYNEPKEVRGVTVDYPEGSRRVRVVLRDTDGENYQTIEVSSSAPGDAESIRAEVSRHLAVDRETVSVSRHIWIKTG